MDKDLTPKHPLLMFREAHGLSQTEAAAKVGIVQSMWQRLEAGTAYASPALARKISDLTGCDFERLLNFGDNDSVDSVPVDPPAPTDLTRNIP